MTNSVFKKFDDLAREMTTAELKESIERCCQLLRDQIGAEPKRDEGMSDTPWGNIRIEGIESIESANLNFSDAYTREREIEKLKAERKQLVALAKFGKWCFDEFWSDRLSHVNDEDGNDISDQTEKLGLIVEVDADIQAHWVPSSLAKLPDNL